LTQALNRDEGRCVVTGTTDPDVCHIFPFADNESDQYRHHLVGLFHMEAFWGEARCRRLYKSLSSGRLPNVIDTAANMICLSREVHSSWAQGFLAFEPLETPATC
ncbi:integral membrane protein, partial [Colletotrichum asianum]